MNVGWGSMTQDKKNLCVFFWGGRAFGGEAFKKKLKI